jgi:Tol biopolymer transport system component
LIELNVACLSGLAGTPQARFRLRNVGGDMLSPGTITLDAPGELPLTASFLLLAGENTDYISAGGTNVLVAYRTLTISQVTLGVNGTCLRGSPATPTAAPILATSTPVPASASTATLTVVPTGVAAPAQPTATPAAVPVFPNASLAASEVPDQVVSIVQPTQRATQRPLIEMVSVLPRLGATCDDMSVIDSAECSPQSVTFPRITWAPITLGEVACPDWLVYHTNMTGDWEIFRQGELPNGIQSDANLSRGIGSRVNDLMPALSYDRGWIAFVSNRDGNPEIYISAVQIPLIQRVTYTPGAVELDPVWSPINGQIVYESNRDGNWNLYLFDTATGAAKRLTDATGSEVNAAWSPDGQHVAFQTDRDGLWQIYEIDMTTGQQRRLSDGGGSDYGPHYSNDGRHIVFQSLRAGTDSGIYLMNADGSDVTRISDPAGNALNPAWSPDDRLIAYQSNLDGDDDIYVYQVSSKLTRHLTDNTIRDYAPTWECNAPLIVFTSNITGDANLFSAPALPIEAPAILVERQAAQLTFDPASDQYPLSSPREEDASREGHFLDMLRPGLSYSQAVPLGLRRSTP